jgi:hypothetical protein
MRPDSELYATGAAAIGASAWRPERGVDFLRRVVGLVVRGTVRVDISFSQYQIQEA